MIRYFCDLCGREIDPDDDVHFVVEIDVRQFADRSGWKISRRKLITWKSCSSCWKTLKTSNWRNS